MKPALVFALVPRRYGSMGPVGVQNHLNFPIAVYAHQLVDKPAYMLRLHAFPKRSSPFLKDSWASLLALVGRLSLLLRESDDMTLVSAN